MKKRWTKTEEEFIVENSFLSNQEIGEILGRTAMSVSKKKSRLDNSIEKRRWTNEEDNYLELSWSNITKKKIAEKLGRSENSIKRRALILGLGKRYNRDGYYLTTGDVSQITGIHPATIRKRVLEGTIKAKYYGNKRIAQISPDSMIAYIEKNIKVIDTKNIDWAMVKIYYISERNKGVDLSVEQMISNIERLNC